MQPGFNRGGFSGGTLDMRWKKVIISFPLVVLCIVLSISLLDKNTALLVKKMLMSSNRFSFFSMDIPDFLFVLVCLITVTAWVAFFYFTRKGIYNVHTRFFQLVAITVPVTNLVKATLKYAFGRINTRFWLQHPGAREFHWFHGSAAYSGFPSGHMAVFTVLVIALSIFYPRYKTLYGLFLALLAFALIATNYHFISDIIAGAYVGVIVHSFTQYWLTIRRRSNDDSNGAKSG
jgi:membrane-associated phospholipid phosphatase